MSATTNKVSLCDRKGIERGCLREAPCLSLIMSPSSTVVERSGSDNEFFLTFFFLFKFIDLTCNLCRQTRQNLSVGLSELMIPV